ncbi:MAG: circadian clock KaiB family protein [Nitrospirae bacterium]|nr:circadian clock KaiB family protein [Nitrospirota bacterium]
MLKNTTEKELTWGFQLYVVGQRPASIAAITNLTMICKEHLDSQYSIEVIDLLEQPQLAKAHQIVAIPTLVRNLPQPLRKIIGDLSDTDKVLACLDIKAKIRQQDGNTGL